MSGAGRERLHNTRSHAYRAAAVIAADDYRGRILPRTGQRVQPDVCAEVRSSRGAPDVAGPAGGLHHRSACHGLRHPSAGRGDGTVCALCQIRRLRIYGLSGVAGISFLGQGTRRPQKQRIPLGHDSAADQCQTAASGHPGFLHLRPPLRTEQLCRHAAHSGTAGDSGARGQSGVDLRGQRVSPSIRPLSPQDRPCTGALPAGQKHYLCNC